MENGAKISLPMDGDAAHVLVSPGLVPLPFFLLGVCVQDVNPDVPEALVAKRSNN